MINTPELYARLKAMTEQERQEKLDPICQAFEGKCGVADGGPEAVANRLFALAALDFYRTWQQEIFNRE